MKHKSITDYAVVNHNTGEIKCYLTEKEIKYLESNRTNGSIRLNNEGRKDSTNLFKMFVEEKFGKFYFLKYKNFLKNEHLFRFLYLSTFVNYKGYLQFGAAKEESKLVKEEVLREMLEPLKRKAMKETIQYFFNEQLLKKDKDGYIYIEKKYICRGRLSNKNMENYTKIIDKNIQNLYQNSNSKEHKTIDLIFKLLPYVNFKYNFICSNPKEENIELITPLKQAEILKILNVSKMTGTKMLNLKILDNQESVFCKVSNAFVKNIYALNPRLTFKTNNLEELEEQLTFFKVAKRS